MVTATQRVPGELCVKIRNGDKEVSIAMEGGEQLPASFTAASLSIFQGNNNITKKHLNSDEVLSPSIDEIIVALICIRDGKS